MAKAWVQVSVLAENQLRRRVACMLWRLSKLQWSGAPGNLEGAPVQVCAFSQQTTDQLRLEESCKV